MDSPNQSGNPQKGRQNQEGKSRQGQNQGGRNPKGQPKPDRGPSQKRSQDSRKYPDSKSGGQYNKRYSNQGKGRPGPKSRQSPKSLLLSVVVPVYNEEESLGELSLQLESHLNKITSGRYEVLFIDDGSTDGSLAQMKRINSRNRNFRALSFRRNYGKSAALAVGFEHARAPIVVTMDSDLQDDPEEIQHLINKLKEGYDLVSGWKQKRKDPISKTIPSKFFNFVTSVMSGLKLHDYNCGLKAYKKEVIKTVEVYGEMHRYIPALAHWEGFKVAEVPVKHRPRQYGKSKFGLSRFVNGFLDLLTVMFTTRYLKRPLHFFGTLGAIFAMAGFGIDLYLVIKWGMGDIFLSNKPMLLFGIALIIVGVQLISLGLLGEMMVKNSHVKSNYSVKEKIF